jgi:hypothetical protein
MISFLPGETTAQAVVHNAAVDEDRRQFLHRSGSKRTRGEPVRTGYPLSASSHPQKRPLTPPGVVEIGQKRLVLHAHGYR